MSTGPSNYEANSYKVQHIFRVFSPPGEIPSKASEISAQGLILIFPASSGAVQILATHHSKTE